MFIDLTEILENPYRTGIQRVIREIIRHWAGDTELYPVRFDATAGSFFHVPKGVLTILSDPPSTMKDERKALRSVMTPSRVARDSELSRGLFNPEVFYESHRSAEYSRLCEHPNANVAWLVYDFLPFITDYYPEGTREVCHPYISALSDVKHISFISEQTRAQFGTFFRRIPADTGPTFRLGGDSLKLERQFFDPRKVSFVTIGTIERKKNIPAIIKAFELLWAKGLNVELVVIGRLVEQVNEDTKLVRRQRWNRKFTHLSRASDEAICAALRKARATIFVSDSEGYGLPPIESLASGIPVIGSSRVPSLQDLPAGGRIMIDGPSPAGIADAVQRMMDDRVCSELWEQAGEIKTPLWQDFVEDISKWLDRSFQPTPNEHGMFRNRSVLAR